VQASTDIPGRLHPISPQLGVAALQVSSLLTPIEHEKAWYHDGFGGVPTIFNYG
jgi:hypothetical protein